MTLSHTVDDLNIDSGAFLPTLVGTARSQVSQDVGWSAQVDHDRIVLQQANFFQLRCQPTPSAKPLQFVLDCVVLENDVATSHA